MARSYLNIYWKRFMFETRGIFWCLMIFIITTGCGPSELAVVDVYRCDEFSNDGCLLPRQVRTNYHPKLPPERMGSWESLSNYLYFHSRETPGIRINFNRTLSEDELQLLQKGVSCRYQIQKGKTKFTGELEGIRVDKSGFWCFDYLGAMLLDFIKKTNQKNLRPDPELFPLTLVFLYKSHNPHLNGEFKSEIYIHWDR